MHSEVFWYRGSWKFLHPPFKKTRRPYVRMSLISFKYFSIFVFCHISHFSTGKCPWYMASNALRGVLIWKIKEMFASTSGKPYNLMSECLWYRLNTFAFFLVTFPTSTLESVHGIWPTMHSVVFWYRRKWKCLHPPQIFYVRTSFPFCVTFSYFLIKKYPWYMLDNALKGVLI